MLLTTPKGSDFKSVVTLIFSLYHFNIDIKKKIIKGYIMRKNRKKKKNVKQRFGKLEFRYMRIQIKTNLINKQKLKKREVVKKDHIIVDNCFKVDERGRVILVKGYDRAIKLPDYDLDISFWKVVYLNDDFEVTTVYVKDVILEEQAKQAKAMGCV